MPSTKPAIDHLNKAFTEVSHARHITKELQVSKKDYERIIQIFNVLGKMRGEYLYQLEKKNAA